MSMSVLILERTASGSTVLERLTCVPGAEGVAAHQRLKNEPGGPQGKPIWVWNSIPAGTVVGADFTGAIICAATASQTQVLVNAFKANPTTAPEDVLTYAP